MNFKKTLTSIALAAFASTMYGCGHNHKIYTSKQMPDQFAGKVGEKHVVFDSCQGGIYGCSYKLDVESSEEKITYWLGNARHNDCSRELLDPKVDSLMLVDIVKKDGQRQRYKASTSVGNAVIQKLDPELSAILEKIRSYQMNEASELINQRKETEVTKDVNKDSE